MPSTSDARLAIAPASAARSFMSFIPFTVFRLWPRASGHVQPVPDAEHMVFEQAPDECGRRIDIVELVVGERTRREDGPAVPVEEIGRASCREGEWVTGG